MYGPRNAQDAREAMHPPGESPGKGWVGAVAWRGRSGGMLMGGKETQCILVFVPPLLPPAAPH